MQILFAIEQEGLKHDDPGACLRPDPLKDRAVVGLGLLRGGLDARGAEAMPDVVDADEDGDDIGLEGQCIGIQPVKQLTGAVAADAEIDEFKIDLGELCRDQLGSVLGIAISHVVVISLISARVGYAVALKQDLHRLTLRSRPLLHRMQRQRCTRRCRCA